MVYPRSAAHWASLLARYSKSYFVFATVYRNNTDRGDYTTCIMRNPAFYSTGCPDWSVPDGGRWWLRDTTFYEPNGNYRADDVLGINSISLPLGGSSIYFDDDYNNSVFSTINYICSPNDKP